MTGLFMKIRSGRPLRNTVSLPLIHFALVAIPFVPHCAHLKLNQDLPPLDPLVGTKKDPRLEIAASYLPATSVRAVRNACADLGGLTPFSTDCRVASGPYKSRIV